MGTAGWSIPKEGREDFAPEGSHLIRYASRLRLVEINSTFYRRHRRSTFERWSAETPDDFEFAVKMPRTVTHDAELSAPDETSAFFDDVEALGRKLGPVLIQLPPSQPFDRRRARAFLKLVRERHAGSLVIEPRHPGWYVAEASELLRRFRVARVIADPPRPREASFPGGSDELLYVRWHGSPDLYWSPYGEERVRPLAARLLEHARTKKVYVIFDNTAAGYATRDALLLTRMLAGEE